MINKFYTAFESDFNNNNIDLQLPTDIQKIYYTLQQDFEEIKKTILYKIASQRIDQNFNGRIKRMLENVLLQKFGTVTFSDEQITFVYDYL